MEMEDIEDDEANTGEGTNDQEMDAKEDEEEGQMADEERTEGMEGSEKQDEGESPRVSGYQVLSLRRYAVSDEALWNRNNQTFTSDTSSYLYTSYKRSQKCGRTGVHFERQSLRKLSIIIVPFVPNVPFARESLYLG